MPFQLDERLGIEVPNLAIPFEELRSSEQEEMLIRWERIRSRIPDQIMQFEHEIENLLRRVHEEDDWDTIADHFAQISEYASRIAELNTWRRIDPSLPSAVTSHFTAEHRDREK